MNKLKLLSLLALPAIVVPIITTLSSCSSLGSMTKVITMEDFESTQPKTYGQLKGGGPSLHKLLYGTKSFYHGNYLMFFSLSSNAVANNFLFGNNASYMKYANPNDPDDSSIFKNILISNQSILYNAINLYKEYPTQIDDIGVVTIIEETIYQEYAAENNEDHPLKPCTPFDKYNDRDQKVNDKHKSGALVRKDGAAKAWRSFNREIKALYAITDVIESNDYFICVQCIKGIPITSNIIRSDADANILTDSAFALWLDTNAKKAETWK